MPGSKLAWKIVDGACTFGAVLVARKAIDGGWEFVTGKPPPTDPRRLDVDWREAFAWVVVSGGGMLAARLFAARTAASYWQFTTGEPPPLGKPKGKGKSKGKDIGTKPQGKDVPWK